MVISAVARAAAKIAAKTGTKRIVKKIRAPRGVRYVKDAQQQHRGTGPNKSTYTERVSMNVRGEPIDDVRYDKHAKRLNITKESTDRAKYSYDKTIKHKSLGRLGSGFSVSDSDYKVNMFADFRQLFPREENIIFHGGTNIHPNIQSMAKDDIAAIYEAQRKGIEPERVFWSKDKNAYYYHSKGQLVSDFEFGMDSWVPFNKKPTGPLRHFKDVKFKKPSKSRNMLIGSKKGLIVMGDDTTGTPFLRKKTFVSADKEVYGYDLNRPETGGLEGRRYITDDPNDGVRSMKYLTTVGEDTSISTYGIRLPITNKGLPNKMLSDEFEYPGYGIQVVTARIPSVVGSDSVTRRVVSIGRYRDMGYNPKRIVQLTTTKTPKISGKRKTTRAKTKVKVQYTSNRKRKIGGSWVDTSKRQKDTYAEESRIITDEAYGFGFTLPHPTKLEKYAIVGGAIGGTAYGVGQIKKKKKKGGKR